MKKTTEENINLTEKEQLAKNIEEWKKQYCAVYKTNIAGYEFVFRPISRAEYKFFRKEAEAIDENDDRLEFRMDNEEKVVKVATLYPEAEELDKILNDCGGIANILSDDIMYYSGFAEESVTKL